MGEEACRDRHHPNWCTKQEMPPPSKFAPNSYDELRDWMSPETSALLAPARVMPDEGSDAGWITTRR
jgi:hypothetical protein